VVTTSMLGPDGARASVAQLYDRRFADWAVGNEPVATAAVDVPLRPPTEVSALRDPHAVATWIGAWRDADPARPADAEVLWEAKRWASMGTQQVPCRLRLSRPEHVARFARRLGHWQLALERAEALLDQLGRDAQVVTAVRRTLRAVVALDAVDAQRLQGVLSWLLDNPRSGLYVRQLPIRGIDSKWLEHHRWVVDTLFIAATGRSDLGLATRPGTIRVRFLDQRLAPGGITDVTAPIAQLAGLALQPRHVLVVENLETLLALPSWRDVVAVHGQGYAARHLDEVPWISAADVVYWGDLDTDGMNILAIVRGKLAHTRSVLMDRATLEAHADLCVSDPKPRRSFTGPLTDIEIDTIAALRDAGDSRLEQERIPWDTVLTALRQELNA
jgi:hypothetical protein